MNHKNFIRDLNSGNTEEDIKNSYAKHFGIKYDTSERLDLHTPRVLFEFKYNKNLGNIKSRATVLAQTLYYVHRLDYLEKTLGKKWWEKNYRIWDMAAGTGNLQYHLPSEAYENTYLSTIHHEDIIHCNKLFPNATVFHYDYLNDDVENLFANGSIPFGITWKLPEKLRNDLANPKLKWVILINPPFATSQTAGAAGKSKKDVSDTKIRTVMHKQDLGEVSRELFAQFLFRIKVEFAFKTTHLGLFSKLKYLNATNDQKFRDNVFNFKFETGFMFSSVNFDGTSESSQFPVGFLVWDLNIHKRIELQKIILDIFDTDVEKIGRKHILIEHKCKLPHFLCHSKLEFSNYISCNQFFR